MRLTVPRSNLKSALEQVVPIAGVKSSIPILRNVLLSATGDGELFIGASNMEQSILRHVLADIHSSGSITIPGRLLLDVANAAVGDIDLSVDGATVFVTSGKSKWKLLGQKADDYPTMPRVSDAKQFTLPGNTLRQLIQQSMFACASDETRPAIRGIHFQGMAGDAHLEVASTDTMRVTVRTLEIDEPVEFEFTLPREVASILLRVIDDSGEAKISTGTNGIEYECGDVLIHSRVLSDAPFPAFRRVIPTNFTGEFRIERQTALDIIKRVSLVSDDNSKIVLIKWDDTQCGFIASSANNGTAEEYVDHLGAEGTGLFAFDSNYLSEALAQITGDVVRFQESAKLCPVVITGGNEDYLYVQMPCRIPDWYKEQPPVEVVEPVEAEPVPLSVGKRTRQATQKVAA